MTTAPAWIWTDTHGSDRNDFSLFRRVFDLPAWPDEAELHLFADARYRLRVNGVIVAYGPGRFVPANPVFDTIDLKSWLRPGSNVVAVEAWAPNANSYQAMPESRGGFIAWGAAMCSGTYTDLATPGVWQARRADAWDGAAPAFSFAQGPVEILDLARLPDAWFHSADAAGWQAPSLRTDGPWGPLEPRRLPDFGHRLQCPARFAILAALDDGETRVSCRCFVPDMRRKRGSGLCLRFPYALAIRSPKAQTVTLGLFWGPHFLNGAALAMRSDPLLGNRQNTDADLQEGWNLLYGEPEVATDIWAQYVAVPRVAGLELAALRSGPALPESELVAERGAIPAAREDLARLPFAWSETQPSGAGAIPARDVAWDRVGRTIATEAPASFPVTLDAGRDPAGWVFLNDFAGEFLGHAVIDIDAPAGTIVDVAVDERRRSDGLLGLYVSNPYTDSADRVLLSGGRQTVELFHPRGGRYLQVTVRPPREAGSVTVHGIAVRDHQVPIPREGSFACADPVFDWIWEASHRTLQACTEDAFLDCPWRERGTYLGDSMVATATLAAFTSNLAVAKRSLLLWAQGQLPDGQMQACVPSWHRRPHEDFSLIWILLLHHLWRCDGDLTDAARWWPVAGRILASPAWKSGVDGLWDMGPETHQFIDWGVVKEDRIGEANACINAFRYRALVCAGELALALGRRDEAGRLAAEAETVAIAFRRRLWIADEGRFARCAKDGHPERPGEALHANALALAFGLADPAQAVGVVAHLERSLTVNIERAIKGRNNYHIELYFLSYVLEGLYRHGRTATAERVMREHWGVQMTRGAWTIWECLYRGLENQGSLCHAWSTTPVRWFHERILGVRPETDGNISRLLIAPDSLLEWAEGVVPHPAGVVRVSWRRSGGRLELRVSAPPGVHLRIEPGPAFAGLQLDTRIG